MLKGACVRESRRIFKELRKRKILRLERLKQSKTLTRKTIGEFYGDGLSHQR